MRSLHFRHVYNDDEEKREREKHAYKIAWLYRAGRVGCGHLQINLSETYVVGLLVIKKIFDTSADSLHVSRATQFDQIKIFTSIHFVLIDSHA